MDSKRIKRVILAVLAAAAVIAGGKVAVPRIRERNANIAMGREWAGYLNRHARFSAQKTDHPLEMEFHYASLDDPRLVRLRREYKLDEIAGPGSETERIINLTRWVFRLTGHANEPRIPKELNALALIPLVRDEHMLINCYMKTVILNEVCLALGFASRQVHLLPYEKEEEESHFITSVYARTLKKWVLMDPDCGAYVTDEQGTLLGVSEIRVRLAAGRKLVVKDLDDDRGFLYRVRSGLRDCIRGVDYPWFLTEFVFKMRCPRESLFDQASIPGRTYFELIPDGYREELLGASEMNKKGNLIVFINDEVLFWREPVEVR
jgi:hypothetical protein